MTALLIRPERADDAPAVRRVLLAAFPSPAEADLVERLRAAGHASIARVAERRRPDGSAEVVGHVCFSPVTLEARCAAGGGLGLAPVAVLPGEQGRGIGGWLVTEGVAACERLEARFVVVLGEPAWYRALGFEPASRYGLASDYDAGDAFMIRNLRPGNLPVDGGRIHYAPAFAAL